jgi:hypothetical protein
MVEPCMKCLLLNGSIVLMAGLLSGVPMGFAIIREKAETKVRAWRVAHTTLIMDGLLMIIVGIAVPALSLGEGALGLIAWSLIISSHGFVLALTVGAWKGCQGLTPAPCGIRTVLYGGHIVGALGSLVGITVLILGLSGAL